MDFSEKWGRNVEEAVHLALADLKVDIDQVTVTVLEEPSKGFLGFGSKLAKVRVEKKQEQKQEPVRKEIPPESRMEPKPVRAESKPADQPMEKTDIRERRDRVPTKSFGTGESENGKRKPPRRDRERRNPGQAGAVERTSNVSIRIRPENMEPVEADPALDFLRELVQKMGLTLTVSAMKNEECIYFEMSGRDSGTVIGKRGQTLDSIQYLTSLVVNRDTSRYLRVIVDAEDYRQKREKTLEQLANRLADKVVKSGRSVRLEPMNPYERKVIHATLQKHSQVTTVSEGEEPNRRVIIERK